jgi:hypothetical protein
MLHEVRRQSQHLIADVASKAPVENLKAVDGGARRPVNVPPSYTATSTRFR